MHEILPQWRSMMCLHPFFMAHRWQSQFCQIIRNHFMLMLMLNSHSHFQSHFSNLKIDSQIIHLLSVMVFFSLLVLLILNSIFGNHLNCFRSIEFSHLQICTTKNQFTRRYASWNPYRSYIGWHFGTETVAIRCVFKGRGISK